MALPPIISNLPIIKLFTKPQTAANSQKGDAVKAAADNDSVRISAAASRQLRLSGAAAITDSAMAGKTAADTRAMLAANNVALGLDPKFSG